MAGLSGLCGGGRTGGGATDAAITCTSGRRVQPCGPLLCAAWGCGDAGNTLAAGGGAGSHSFRGCASGSATLATRGDTARSDHSKCGSSATSRAAQRAGQQFHSRGSNQQCTIQRHYGGTCSGLVGRRRVGLHSSPLHNFRVMVAATARHHTDCCSQPFQRDDQMCSTITTKACKMRTHRQQRHQGTGERAGSQDARTHWLLSCRQLLL